MTKSKCRNFLEILHSVKLVTFLCITDGIDLIVLKLVVFAGVLFSASFYHSNYFLSTQF